MPTPRETLIPPTANSLLEAALREKLAHKRAKVGSLGEIEPLALRLGMVCNSLRPRMTSGRLVVFAGDHGLAVDAIEAGRDASVLATLQALLDERLPLAVFARQNGLELSVIDSGLARDLPPHEKLLARKIAHGTRHARLGAAMSVEQAHAALRAG